MAGRNVEDIVLGSIGLFVFPFTVAVDLIGVCMDACIAACMEACNGISGEVVFSEEDVAVLFESLVDAVVSFGNISAARLLFFLRWSSTSSVHFLW